MRAHQIELCELGPHLGEDWEESVCIEVSTPQVELLHIKENSQRSVQVILVAGKS